MFKCPVMSRGLSEGKITAAPVFQREEGGVWWIGLNTHLPKLRIMYMRRQPVSVTSFIRSSLFIFMFVLSMIDVL